MGRRAAVNRQSAGSNPARAARRRHPMVGALFRSEGGLSSILSGGSDSGPVRPKVRMRGFQPRDGSSSLLRVTHRKLTWWKRLLEAQEGLVRSQLGAPCVGVALASGIGCDPIRAGSIPRPNPTSGSADSAVRDHEGSRSWRPAGFQHRGTGFDSSRARSEDRYRGCPTGRVDALQASDRGCDSLQRSRCRRGPGSGAPAW